MARAWSAVLAVAVVTVCFQMAWAAGPTIDEVWMRYGGGRPYYDSIMEPRQMDMNGMRRRDPAFIRNLPPITPYPAQAPRRMSSKSSAPSAVMPGQTSTPAKGMPPAGQATTAKPRVPSAPAVPVPAVPVPAVPKTTAPTSAAPGVPTALSPAPPTFTTGDGLAPATRNGSIARPEGKDQVFMDPPSPASNVPAGAAATSAAATRAAGAGGTMQGTGSTARQGQVRP